MSRFGESMRGRSVFVTGASGMLGSWLVRALLDRGATVTVLRRDEVRASMLTLDGLEARCTVVRGDLLTPGLVERAIGEHECDTVFHLAAQTIVGTANRSPVPTFEANIRGTWLLMDACRTHDVRRVVVAASDTVYGVYDELPYREDFAFRARFPYDVSKAATDLIARSYWHTYGVPVAITRLANIYGGGDLNRSRLLPEAIAAVLRGRAPIIRSDGSPERDFLYVEDAADAYLAICDALDADEGCVPGAVTRARGEAFNAGGGRPHSVRSIIDAVVRVSGHDLTPDVRGTGTPSGEIDRKYGDSSKLRDRTGWEPRVGLDEGVERTIAWYREHLDALPT
ncbi:NAD(P)-dependent oxidoreductase [Patulibacter sp.]|uniref:NAD-dependent epimerase/dehydratase family protein n=1 Tax=Patulibacter sp. TaxID=1912859 RepID=UPI0027158531|nr:NAD-dependent epimerase/dehydratase family protein [Patulibacter sp.]MDO9408205.1 NAD-dependent epimerase/dehydratase family protein [Patulibacter sp.]